MIEHKSLLDVGQEKISKLCILSNCSLSIKLSCDENLDGVDEDVAGGGDDEEEVGEVDQPGLGQRDWGTFECLQNANHRCHHCNQSLLSTHHNHLIYVEASPWCVADQLDDHDCQEQSFH